MKSKDQLALEQLYTQLYKQFPIVAEIQLLDEKGVWKKIAPFAAAAALGTSAFAKDINLSIPHDVTKNDVVYAKNVNDYNTREMSVENITKQLKRTLETQIGDKISKMTVEVTERKDSKDGYTDVVVSVMGEVLAATQEEANNIATRTVGDAIVDAGIRLEHLQVVAENKQQLFEVKLKIIFRI
jgi:hypothetical protein